MNTRPPDLHCWDLSPDEAVRVQLALRARLNLRWDGRAVNSVGGVDIGLKGDSARAAIVVLHYPDLSPIESATVDMPLSFPYIPGLLAFREAPAVLAAWQRLHTQPDVLMFDGQGIAHPRGLGIASHVGLWLERPTIGVAKSRLYGHHAQPDWPRGSLADLRDERDPACIIGQVVRTRNGVKPLYISPGHLMDTPHAVEFVLACCTRYRLPETTRWAHMVAGGHTLDLASAS